MKAKVCKNCRKRNENNGLCSVHTKVVSPWNDWCDWRKNESVELKERMFK